MPPKLKVGKKGKKKGKGKKGKGKKGKKIKKLDPALPLHNLTTLYNLLREKAYDIRRIEGKVKKKRIEGWYMTREMLNLKHDNQLYHEHLQHKMDQLKKIIAEIESVGIHYYYFTQLNLSQNRSLLFLGKNLRKKRNMSIE